MAWKRILILTRNNFSMRNKRTHQNGKSGKNSKRKDSMTLKKKSKSLTNRTTNFGMISTKPKRLIGNKSTTLTGSNGRWKSRPEKSTKSKDKKKDKCTRKKINNTKNNKNSKSISGKSNYATSSFSILTTSETTGTEQIKPVKTLQNKLSMSALRLLQIRLGRRRKSSWLNQRNLRLKKRPQRRVKTKRTKLNRKQKSKKCSTFHMQFKTNSKRWKY